MSIPDDARLRDQPGTSEEARLALAAWKRRDAGHLAERDRLVRAAYPLMGGNIRQISLVSGISRTTVYKILRKETPVATIREGSHVRYSGDLPAGWDHNDGRVVALIPDAGGDSIATVEFGPGMTQDIPASELVLDPGDTGPRFEDWSAGWQPRS